jgi:hypothetical protein
MSIVTAQLQPNKSSSGRILSRKLPSIKRHRFEVTVFKNAFATSLEVKQLTLPEMAELVLQTKRSTKAKLPWWKMAQFGDVRSDKGNSLRHDGNLLGIAGIELDYDKEVMSFDEAVEILKGMGVRCLIYTSPSHTANAPRWRIMLPTSKPLPTSMRAKLVARVNNRFGGIFASESFTLSQSYFCGQAKDNPEPNHRAEVLDGNFIDQCGALPVGVEDISLQPAKTAEPSRNYYQLFGDESGFRYADEEPRGFDEHIALMGDGESLRGFNAVLISATSAYASEHGADFDRAELKRVLRAAIDAAPRKATRKASDITRYRSDSYLDSTIASAVRKFAGPVLSQNTIVGTGEAPPVITATPFRWIDPSEIPPRRWLYRPYYIRQFSSLTLSTGGVGKSSLLIAEALALATGKPLLGIKPVQRSRVWYFNGEDPQEELDRRFAATGKHYKLTEKDIGDYLFVDSGRTMPIVLVEDGRNGTVIAKPIVEQIIATIRDRKIDVLIIDPFVSTHRVIENDNGAIDRVAKLWSQIAEATNCSIMLAHHTRKTQGGNVAVEDGRGAGALLAAVRVARTLNTMTSAEAEEANIEANRRGLYFRSDIGKSNLTRPAEKADWFLMESIDLGNTKPMEEKDTVGAVTPWDYPAFHNPVIDEVAMAKVLKTVRAGGPWRVSIQAEKWIGYPLAHALGLNLESKKARKYLIDLINDLTDKGLLVRGERPDPGTRKIREFIEVAS